MTGLQFEHDFCKWLQNRGYWALNIPRAKTGAQPFDVIAMRGHFVLCADCKVVSSQARRFTLERVEDNQWLAMQSCRDKTGAFCVFAVFHVITNQLFLIPYIRIEDAKKAGAASIELTAEYLADKLLPRMERYLW